MNPAAAALICALASGADAPSPVVTGTATGQEAVDLVLSRVEAAEDSTRDVSLRFTQTMLLKATGDSQSTTGTLALLRSPERFRVAFTTPTEQVALYDGTYLWLYLPEAGQAFRQKAGSDDLARVLGLNPAEPVRSFRRGYRASLAGCDGRGCTLDFTRGGASPMTWHVRLSSSTWQMVEAWYENEEVKVSLSCYDYRVNRSPSPRSFKLTLPKDVEIQEGLPMLFGRQGR